MIDDPMSLIDILLAEQLQEIFVDALFNRAGVDLQILYGDGRDVEPSPIKEFPQVRMATPGGQSILVTPRRIAQEVGEDVREIVEYSRLLGYDWIAPEVADKVEMKEQHYDRLYLYLRGGDTRVLEKLGPAVYPLMTFLGKVVELNSEKVLLRKMDPEVVELLGNCIEAAAKGPFFPDREMRDRFGRDRGSLQVLAHLWPGINLASPEIERTLSRVVHNMLDIRPSYPDRWEEWVEATPEQVEAALEVFRQATGAYSG